MFPIVDVVTTSCTRIEEECDSHKTNINTSKTEIEMKCFEWNW